IKTGEYIYFSLNDAIVAVFDAGNPSAIDYISDVSGLVGFSGNHVQDGNRLYLMDGNTLTIWNLSSPLNPQWMGSYTLPGSVASFQANGDHAFVNYFIGVVNFQLSVLDVSNPQNITQLRVQPGDYYNKMLLYGNLLYAAYLSSGIYILDISNPQAPSQVGLIPPPIDYSWSSIDCVIDGSWLYTRWDPVLIDGRNVTTFMRYDLANPLAPVALDAVLAGHLACFDVENNRVYMAESFGQLGIHAPANSNAMTRVGQIQRNSVLGSELVNGYLYLNNGYIIDTTQPNAQAGFFANSGFLASDDSALYTTQGVSIRKWDLSQPMNPTIAADLQIYHNEYYGGPNPLSVVGDWIYTLGRVINTDLDPQSTIQNINYHFSRVVSRQNYAYALDGNMVRVYSIIDPSDPQLVNTMNFSSAVHDLVIHGDVLIVARMMGLGFYSLSDPAAPMMITHKPNIVAIRKMKTMGNYLVTVGDHGIIVYSLYEITDLPVVGSFHQDGEYMWDVDLAGTTAYVSQSKYLGIYDLSEAVSNPDYPELPSPVLSLGNYPNPFSSQTTIRIQGKALDLPCEINIYNLRGQIVRRLHKGYLPSAGMDLIWDAKDDAGIAVANGLYLYSFSQGTARISKRMLLLRQ
ncbi:MAG: hypothetical protein U1B83_02270, partial [Candidatus Cloacimonadaceae bacterium]|nr:hypothetical protein [Candidatus Cloacimonadaceae bacterium]